MVGKFEPENAVDDFSQRWYFRRDSPLVPADVYQIGIAVQSEPEGSYLYAYGDRAPPAHSTAHPSAQVMAIDPSWDVEKARRELESWLASEWGLTLPDAKEAAQAMLEAAWLSAHPA